MTIDNVHFVIIDVGGQRSERRKWMHAFDEVTAVNFVAALSEFDQMMFEDTSANRMVDALELFDKTCNGAVFKNTPIILFLNKSDLFRTKIAETQIAATPAFGDFSGKPHDFDDGVECDAMLLLCMKFVRDARGALPASFFAPQLLRPEVPYTKPAAGP